MATQQELDILREAVEVMKETHLKEVEELRKQLLEERTQVIKEKQEDIQKVQIKEEPPKSTFSLTPEQTVNHFRHLKAFNGSDEYKLTEFIKSVENAGKLCNGNRDLEHYVMQIILNDKIQGEAKRCVQRLGDNLVWKQVKTELRLHFRPRHDYAELINRCRNLKVSNLRELFDNVRDTNYLLNELYDFDEDKPIIYTPENNDRFLVGIIMEKLDNLIRGYVPTNGSLIEIYNKFSELKLLDDERAVSNLHKKHNFFEKRDNNPNFTRRNNFNRSSFGDQNRQKFHSGGFNNTGNRQNNYSNFSQNNRNFYDSRPNYPK